MATNRLETIRVLAPAGGFTFVDYRLGFRTLVAVFRENQVQFQQSTSPSGFEPFYKFTKGYAKMNFSPDNRFGANEYITIIYKGPQL